MTLSFVVPLTTRVVKVAPGPSAASAAAAVTSLVVEAGVSIWEPSRDSSTWPVAGSATTADTCGPRAACDSGPASAERSPLAVGRLPFAPAGVSTVPGPWTRPAATVGTLRAASRDGSMMATAVPATRVNTLIMASVSTAAGLVRRSTTYHLTRYLSRPEGTMELITQTRLGANQWTLTLLSKSPWDSGTSTRWTTSPAGSGWTACCSPRPGTRPTTGSSRTPWPTTATRWTRWCSWTSPPSPAA